MKRRSLTCLITDRHRLSPLSGPSESLETLVAFVGAAARCGVDLIQLREPDLDARDLLTLTGRCVDEAGSASRVLVNDRVDIAVGARAHGVHLKSQSLDAVAVRTLVPADFLIGRSVHSVAEAVEATRRGGLDYLIFGTTFPTTSKPVGSPLAGLAAVASASASVSLPVLAVGGVTQETVGDVAKSGAAGVAAIGLFIPPPGVDVERHLVSVVAAVRRAFDTCGGVP